MTTVGSLAPIAPPPSRLPNVGTTTFTVMSTLAVEKQAVSLGQGFPDFDCDPRIVDAVSDAMRVGLNQYPPMTGMPVLRQVIAAKVADLYDHAYDVDHEITVTADTTWTLLTIVPCCVHPGNGAIVFEPTCDNYAPSIELTDGKVALITLSAPNFHIPFGTLAAAITWRMCLIMLNVSHSPTGTVWYADGTHKLAKILTPTSVLLLSDEVYEHMVYDGVLHASVACIPELMHRALVIPSFGKTYHVTGWEAGYVAAPAVLMAEFRRMHQFNMFTVNTPVQHGLANYMAGSCPYLELPTFYRHKRDLFRTGLENTRFKLLPCQGTYFQCVDYSTISDLPEAEFTKWPTSEIGVTVIPVSAFYSQPHESGMVRLCFTKKDETLQVVLEHLSKV